MLRTALVAILSMVVMATSAMAASFTGSPSPSLSPTFGTLINFDDKATGTAVGQFDYVTQGVASITETEGVGTFARYAGSQSPPNYIGTGFDGERVPPDGTTPAGWDGTILIQFAGLANKVGIGVADSQAGPETISAYGSGMNLLESYTVPAGSNVYFGIDRGASFDIKYFKITGDYFAVDDLQFSATGVPEPLSLLLLGCGLIGLPWIKRLKK